ncbi:M15 family metallopeptidase [Lactiplantibacillus mudanjiangensis]|uniref:D-alanyl-D-alanine dipeptidase n=1 Tax=Lactiplantibacillus mudanjiangensis TaxID=1296538 RepID=A0A660DYK5_9LACO|nr:M15 family metallopeptidase [Lactiplantibacillus mudanjiangensis]VDG24349.1 D-alanyl-D-alanine dipeptidase [Lactobacillus sp.] [Lactiplantibacillus mudanjiangensis]VDG28335.1 D-alanyl-D-alanine dipeptidase [Lactobacillus sp.] [Lactiplantibacillus mudanjiangensis]
MLPKDLTGFTNVQTLDPMILVDLRYATTNNFTHQVIYDFTTAIVRTGTAQKLAQASALVQAQGYRLKIWDAYRPVSAQKRLFDVYPDPNFVAPPDPNFSHQKGVTLDLTLTDMAGHDCLMPTAFDDFSPQAHRQAPRATQQDANYQILDQAMHQAGFIGYENEWWDYRDSQMDDYQPLSADPNDY